MKAFIAIVFIIVIGLAAFMISGQSSVAYWQDTTIPCLPNGHQNAQTHIHPQLTILVDGEKEPIQADIGVTLTCMAEVHTHDQSGAIHIETAEIGTTYTLADFFTVWDRGIEREGYSYTIVVDGEEIQDALFTLTDHQVIEISYQSQ